MKTTETPAPLPAESGAPITKTDIGPPPPVKEKKEGTVLNVFSHGVLVIWAFMVVLPLLWAVMTSFKDDRSIFSSPGRSRTPCTSTTGRGRGPRPT